MNIKLKASIVITNYNQGRFIERSLSSAIGQNFNPNEYEIIIVDDGSTDNSVALISDELEKYLTKTETATNPYFNFIQQSNKRTAGARNTGWKAAKGEVVAFLDADDEYEPNKLKRSYEEIKRYEGVGLVYTDYVEISPDQSKRMFKPPFDKKGLMNSCMVSTNSVYLRDALERIGGFDESLTYAEDFDSYLRLTAAGYMIRHIPEPLFAYFNHGQNKTATSDMTKWQEEEMKFKERARQGEYFAYNS